MKLENRVKTWIGSFEVPGTIKGHTVCTATHPDMSNFSGHSRGRKIHLMKTNNLTFCNMVVDGIAPSNFKNYSMTYNGLCKNCLKTCGQ